MRFDVTLVLPDRPGQLLKALEPIAKYGGNIISIIHDREKVSSKYAVVSLVADFPLRTNFLRAKEALEREGISIIKSEEIMEKETISAILIGRSNLNNLIGEGDMQIIEAEISRPVSGEPCIKLILEVPKDSLSDAMKRLKEIAENGGLLLITQV